MGSLDGKVALVTGAGSGIGRGIVRRFLVEGARVAAVDVVPEAVASLADEFGPDVLPIVADISAWAANQQAVRAALEAFDRLDVFVGNAGLYDQAVALESLSGEEIARGFDELFAVNVKGYLLGARASIEPLLLTRGSMIFTASYASFAPSGGGCLYTASKHAVIGLVRQLAYELAPDIRVNAVAPGVAPTTLSGLRGLGQTPRDAVLPGTERNVPLQAIPSADSYGGLYAFLASQTESGHITGSTFTADSGLSIRGLARPGGRVAT
jgi:NAD(P)-dependent dehydrogenase (short-subunit alcohol dehydrogenase family)